PLSQLVDGTLQKNGTPVQKLIIKSVTESLQGHDLPTWATLALTECLRLRRFKHNHILSIVGIGGNQHKFHILYPNMTQGVLKSVISDTNKDFSVRQLLGFSQQVAEGINFLSSKDVTHKDVAARNGMIDEYSVVKLCDASFAWDLYPDEYVYDSSRERYLPIRWMAPESLTDGYYDMRTDVWSFAVLVWELLTRGCLPFHEVSDSAGVSEYILQGYILGRPDTLSSEVYELLRSCWCPENESRPSIGTVSRTLSDILEAEDDQTYANAGDLASFEHQHSSGLAATPRQHNSDGNFYSTTKLSRV
ncbi:hepatocyte growth factor receptor, partial [Elysia marginata]